MLQQLIRDDNALFRDGVNMRRSQKHPPENNAENFNSGTEVRKMRRRRLLRWLGE